MMKRSLSQRVGQWLAVAALLGFGLAAMAQGAAEPTLKQVYEAAQSGRMEQAQTMMQQVLVAHPKSAKAHFVQAELSARQGDLPRAREALAQAEKLAPGLPFAKPQAVSDLRAQLGAKGSTPAAQGGGSASPALRATSPDASPGLPAPRAQAAPAAPASSFPWGVVLALGGAAVAAGIFLSRRKSTPVAGPGPMQGNTYAPQGSNGLSGPQSFGMGGGGAAAPAYGSSPYGQPGYGQPGYGQQPAAGSGLGGKVVGGLAAGLAVGAGVMAAQAIGKNLMGNNETHPAATPPASEPSAPSNYAMGGQDFGLNNTSSWDDGDAVASSDDGGDWDT